LGAATALTAAGQLRPRGVALLCPAIIFGSSPGAPEPMLTMAPDSTWVDDAGLSHMSDGAGEYCFYSDCSPEMVAEAVAHLRPQGVAGMAGPKAAERTSVPSILIRAEDDRCVAADWQRWAATVLTRRAPVAVPGGHSPFLSRPALLADVLNKFAVEVTPG
jgi:pimeloyl-ACP methyl ester carboxylesterase